MVTRVDAICTRYAPVSIIDLKVSVTLNLAPACRWATGCRRTVLANDYWTFCGFSWNFEAP
jgi:hypothetical protein